MPSGRPKTPKALVDSILADLEEPISAAIADLHPDAGDPVALAKTVLATEVLQMMVWQVVEGASSADCGQRLADAVTELGLMAERLEAAQRTIRRVEKGLPGKKEAAAAMEPQAQLEAIGGLIAARVPHEFRGREHEPIGAVALDVLDKRLPGRDPRGLLASEGWPGRRKAAKTESIEMPGR
ncbi:MAG TPA: hypothetical protein VMW08_00290 [Acidimicrobiales bacterium]|nr:hypothetical protein [Acidimicrobiales bacterium]